MYRSVSLDMVLFRCHSGAMPSLNLRLSDELHAVLVAAAGLSGRSLQREIVMRLDGRVSGGLSAGAEAVEGGQRAMPAPRVTAPEGVAPAESPSGKRSYEPVFRSGRKGGLGSGEVTRAAKNAHSAPSDGLDNGEPGTREAAAASPVPSASSPVSGAEQGKARSFKPDFKGGKK